MPTAIIFSSNCYKAPRFVNQLITYGRNLDDGCRFLVDKDPVYCPDIKPPLEFINNIISANNQWTIFIAYDKPSATDDYLLPVLQQLEMFSLYNDVKLSFIISNTICDTTDISACLRVQEYWRGRVRHIIKWSPWCDLTEAEHAFIRLTTDASALRLAYVPTLSQQAPTNPTDIIGVFIGNNSDDALPMINRVVSYNVGAGRRIFYINPDLIIPYKPLLSQYNNCCVVNPSLSIRDFVKTQNLTPAIYTFYQSGYEPTENDWKLLDELANMGAKPLGAGNLIEVADIAPTSPTLVSRHEMISIWVNTSALKLETVMPWRSRGIIICAGGENYICELVVALSALKDNNVHDPITIMYSGNELSENASRHLLEVLAPLEMDLYFLDIDPLIQKYIGLIEEYCRLVDMPIAQWTARGFQIKQWALILSPYEETMIMDTDIIACRDIDQWWEEMYPHSGGISLYSDYWRTNRSYDKHEGYCTGAFRGIKQSIDRREWIYPLYDRKAEEYDDESGVIFVNRKSINNEIPRFIAMTIAYSYYNSLFYGDKDLYHLAFGVYRAPIKPGSIVRLEDDKNMLIGMVQYTVSGQIGHIHLTIKPIRGNDTTSLISQEQMRITDGSLTTNLSPFISNNTVEFMVPTSQSIVLLPDRIYRLMETGYALSREYFLLSLF